MDNKLAKTLISALAITGTAVAAPALGSFTESIQNVGTCYKDPENPLVQEMKIFGRFQYQAAHLNGNDAASRDFDQNFDEYRRVRAGVKFKLVNKLELMARVNLASDGRPKGGDLKWGYDTFDEAKATFNAGDLGGLEDVKISYGRHTIVVGKEASTSSKKIKTAERSALSNTVFANRYTGIVFSGKSNGVKATVGYLSLDDHQGIGNWDHGSAVYAALDTKALGGKVGFDAFYNMDFGTAKDQVGVGYEQAYSLSWAGEAAPGLEFMADVIVGGKGASGGTFGGIVLQPSTYLIKDTLEFVAQYQFQQSSKENGIKTSSRYLSRIEKKQPAVDANGGKGKSHHSLYGGFNYYLASHNSKIMTGVQLDKLNTAAGTVTASSLWAAYRLYF